MVRDRDTAWEPAMEQTTFDFGVGELAARVRPFASRAADERSRQEDLDADGWYDLGLDLEAVSPAEAAKAYRQALTREPDHAEALEAYERAVSLEPELAAAHFNLARLYEGAGRTEDALRHLAGYRRLRG